MMRELAYVFIGGGAGSVLRYLIGLLVGRLAAPAAMPWATLLANTAGCLLIGLLGALLARGLISAELRLLFIVGLCGGLTTFSTFSAEAVALLRAGSHGILAVYVAASLLAGLTMVWLGHRIACG